MIDDELNVWYEDQLIGYLWRDKQGIMSFKYDDDWNQFPLSISLPLNKIPDSLIAHRFFANLLPEGAARDRLCIRLRCVDTDFDILREIGSECAGAISILPIEKQPNLNQSYKKLDNEVLIKIIETRGASIGLEDKPRLSLAGAQDKITVHLKKGTICFPIDQAPSTCILKFEVRDFKNVPLYEVYTTNLAQAIGLNTIDIKLKFLNDVSYTISKRYDRVLGDRISRIHQEDFCQALGLKEKYQRLDTPSFAQCYQLIIEHSSNPLIDAEQLIKWQIFNLISGNSDAHIKNISFLYRENETRLAPFYDLVCTRAIEHIDETLALAIGNQKNPNQVTKKDLLEMASQCRVRPKRIFDIVRQMLSNIEENKDKVRDELESKCGEQSPLQRVDRIITQQIKQLKQI
ncbi:MAG: type II toxin-antitoxin system HipA family toxin [Methylococcales bacterium]|nr:type II toxin-antitoxin system HipA family toxin [Methylococcales bacterium]